MALEIHIPQPRRDEALSALKTLLAYIGEDPEREGLEETPERVLKSWGELFAGYGQHPGAVLGTTFEEVAGYDEPVILKEIPFHSTCEHHMLPFQGVAHVAYMPAGRVVGLSKLARLVEVFARRLQIQERLTRQVATALMDDLGAAGAAAVVEAEHGCMRCRGVRKEGSKMVTSAFLGVLAEPARRAEIRAAFGA